MISDVLDNLCYHKNPHILGMAECLRKYFCGEEEPGQAMDQF
jgi:hypothetical protein